MWAFRNSAVVPGGGVPCNQQNPVDLAIVRLFEAKDQPPNRDAGDRQGRRFSFLPPPGEYLISAAKLPLLFPQHSSPHAQMAPISIFIGMSPSRSPRRSRSLTSVSLDPPPLEKMPWRYPRSSHYASFFDQRLSNFTGRKLYCEHSSGALCTKHAQHSPSLH